MKRIYFFLSLIILINSCNLVPKQQKQQNNKTTKQQKQQKQRELQEVNFSICEPEIGYDEVKFDSWMLLVFGSDFNDSVYVYKKNILLKKMHIKTNKMLDVCPNFYEIKNLDNILNDTITIFFKDLNKKIILTFKERYRYVYFSRTETGRYFIEYSNFRREYY